MNGKKRVFTPEFIKICFVNFMLMLGQTMTNTLVPLYADVLGASSVIVGMVTGIFSLSALFTQPFGGQALDSFSRKRILMVNSLIISVAFFGFAFSSQVWMLICFRLLHGVGVGITTIACLTMVGDTISPESFTTGIAYYSVAASIAQAIGPSLGLFVQEKLGYQAAFLAGGALMLMATATTTILKEDQRSPKPFHVSLSTIYAKEAVVPAVIMFFLAFVYINVSSFLALYADSIHVDNIGLFFSVNALALLISRPLIGRAADRIGTVRVLPWAIICLGLSMVIISYSTSLGMFLFAAVINAFGYGACQPMIQSLCMKSVPPDRRGSASATSYFGTNLAYLIGPVVAGGIEEKVGYAMMFRTIPLFLLPALAVFAVFRGKIQKIDAGRCWAIKR